MPAFRRRKEQPARNPHPDARIEAELQRIISLRKAVTRKEELLASDHEQIAGMRERVSRRPTWDAAQPVKQQIADLLAETQTLELQITQLHDDIAARIAKLDDADLAWLEEEPS
jgi:Mg2+ and Co2+ transporter CorA